MKTIIDFLRRLAANNNREWFAEHKAEYLAAQARFNELTAGLIERVGQFDEHISTLTVKDCTYRIYRDTRFSADKSPYKTHMGCFLCRGGKKSGYSGYYFHIGVGQGDEYPTGHMLAVGDYCMDAKALQVLREDIVMGGGDFEEAIMKADSSFHLDPAYKLKRPPKGYDETTPYVELLKHKVFCLISEPTENEMLSPNLLDEVAEKFHSAKPFLDYVNRAIEYVKEGNE